MIQNAKKWQISQFLAEKVRQQKENVIFSDNLTETFLTKNAKYK